MERQGSDSHPWAELQAREQCLRSTSVSTLAARTSMINKHGKLLSGEALLLLLDAYHVWRGGERLLTAVWAIQESFSSNKQKPNVGPAIM